MGAAARYRGPKGEVTQPGVTGRISGGGAGSATAAAAMVGTAPSNSTMAATSDAIVNTALLAMRSAAQ